MKKNILLVGLMNPGDKYRFTRHNAGAMALDTLYPDASYAASKKLKSLFAETKDGDTGVILLKPQTFMNLSGRAVKKAMREWHIEPQNMVVFHDEVELPVRTVRRKTGGGHKGHNGLRSIIAEIGSPDFHRVRLGVGRPDDERSGIADFLLSFQPISERIQTAELQPVWQEILLDLSA